MADTPDWAWRVPNVAGLHDATLFNVAKVTADPSQFIDAVELLVDYFVGQIAIAFGGIEILGWHPFAFLATWGSNLQTQSLAAYNGQATANANLADILDTVLGTGHTFHDLGVFLKAASDLGQAVIDAIANALGHAGTGHTVAQLQSYVSGFGIGNVSGLGTYLTNLDPGTGLYNAAAGFTGLSDSILQNLDGTGTYIGTVGAALVSGTLANATIAQANVIGFLTALGKAGASDAGGFVSMLQGLIPAAIPQFDGTAITAAVAGFTDNLDGTVSWAAQEGSGAVSHLIQQADGTIVSAAGLAHNLAQAATTLGTTAGQIIPTATQAAEGVTAIVQNAGAEIAADVGGFIASAKTGADQAAQALGDIAANAIQGAGIPTTAPGQAMAQLINSFTAGFAGVTASGSSAPYQVVQNATAQVANTQTANSAALETINQAIPTFYGGSGTFGLQANETIGSPLSSTFNTTVGGPSAAPAAIYANTGNGAKPASSDTETVTRLWTAALARTSNYVQQTFMGAGQYTFTIPVQYRVMGCKIDYAIWGAGGGGSSGGQPGFTGSGGLAGDLNVGTLTYGVDIPLGTAQLGLLNGYGGSGGAAQFPTGNWGGNGGASYLLMMDWVTVLATAGGGGGGGVAGGHPYGWNPASSSYNTFYYSGGSGGAGGEWMNGQAGGIGAGGGGGGGANISVPNAYPGGRGGDGGAIITAYGPTPVAERYVYLRASADLTSCIYGRMVIPAQVVPNATSWNFEVGCMKGGVRQSGYQTATYDFTTPPPNNLSVAAIGGISPTAGLYTLTAAGFAPLVMTDASYVANVGALYRYGGHGGTEGVTAPGTWLFYDSGPSQGPTVAYVATKESTASTSFADLATLTDTVTVNIGPSGFAIVGIHGDMSGTSSGYGHAMAFAMSGANNCLADTGVLAGKRISQIIPGTDSVGATEAKSGVWLIPNLSGGSTTFKLKYRAGGDTMYAKDRSIWVLPL